ncbi:MAG: alpha/beta fold hydrolase [Pseudomonadota bacterium]|nr:alpha/beta fold hydrolase [Pseudomonadota bacterium]MEC8666435.1 alpha/beta fold hydrolase [Pseudomonadota bacterium]
MLTTIVHDGPEKAPDALPPLVIAHGLFGSARNWSVIAKRLSARRRVIAVDMRNHGNSPHYDTQSYADMAGDLAEVLQAHGTPDLLGHSMGGKAAMTLAVTHPQALRRLVVADIAPVAYTHTQTDKIDAMEAVDLAPLTRRSEAQEALAQQGIDEGLQAFLTQSLDLTEKRWRFNLATLRREMDKIVGFPDLTGQFDGPTLFLTGGDSPYVLPEHRARIKTLLPRARFAKIPGTGHWLHAEKPRDFEATVDAFLSAPDPSADRS